MRATKLIKGIKNLSYINRLKYSSHPTLYYRKLRFDMIMVFKVRAMGINGLVAQWIENWLVGRSQRVVINGVCSEWSEVLSGVPQGSVLWPILFIIFINDNDRNIESRSLKFADDTKLFGCVGTNQHIERLRQDLGRLCSWSEEWLMLFIVDKCKVLHFEHDNPQVVYQLGNSDLRTDKMEGCS
jgi:hypothetical protein